MYFVLTVIKGEQRGEALSFEPGQYVFGRAEKCDVQLDVEGINQEHCLLLVMPRAVFLHHLAYDQGGTWVNGDRILAGRVLSDADRIQIGPWIFEASHLPTEPAKQIPSKHLRRAWLRELTRAETNALIAAGLALEVELGSCAGRGPYKVSVPDHLQKEALRVVTATCPR